MNRPRLFEALAMLASVALVAGCVLFIWSILTAQRGLSVLCVP